jgi:hypothetical protein
MGYFWRVGWRYHYLHTTALARVAPIESFAIREGTANTTGEFLWNEVELCAEYDRPAK